VTFKTLSDYSYVGFMHVTLLSRSGNADSQRFARLAM